MTILGLETSTAVCSVGLFREGAAEIERSLRETHIHSEKLLTLVGEVARAGGIALHQLDAIAVSIGPGSFTGLRIGLSTAKGIAYALDKPLVAISTFAAIAEAGRISHPEAKGFIVLIDAKKEEWYLAQCKIVDRARVDSPPVEIKSTGDALSAIQKNSTFFVLTDKVQQISSQVGKEVTVKDVHEYCRGAVVASLARDKVLKKEFSDVAEVEPVYLKDFVVRAVSSNP